MSGGFGKGGFANGARAVALGLLAGGAILAPVTLASALLATSAAAQDKACAEHVVRAGDSLAAIAAKIPGVSAEAIFQANRDSLKNANLIEIGQVLRIPCAPGETPAGTASGDAASAEAPAAPDATDAPQGSEEKTPSAAPAPAASDAPGADGSDMDGADAAPGTEEAALAPYQGAAAPGSLGWLQPSGKPVIAPPPPPPAPSGPKTPIPAISGGDASGLPAAAEAEARLRAALAQAAPERKLTISWLPREAALNRLHPLGEALIAFAWTAPDCPALARLGEVEAQICTRFDRSAPLAEAKVAWIARKGDKAAEATTPADLRGLRICRPAGRPEADLQAMNLIPPWAKRLAPATWQDCVAMVLKGEADAASLFAGDWSAEPDLVEIPALSETLTLHAISNAASGPGRDALEALNTGLKALRAPREEPQAAP